MDVFFNKAPLEEGDASVSGDKKNVRITCVFNEIPETIILDKSVPTTLKDEYLLNKDSNLEITKVYNCSSSKGKQIGCFLKADHPMNEKYSDLHTLKLNELKTRAKDLEIDLSDIDKTVKCQIRKAIWENTNLNFDEKEINLELEAGKEVFNQIESNLPIYALFKSDRASKDQDAEAQDPMKMAIKETVKEYEGSLKDFIEKVKVDLEKVTKKTVEKIKEMSPELGSALNPKVSTKNWDSLFTVNLTGDEDIPINKRGSGTRRLVLLNFFRAKAESTLTKENKTSVIYAIEEPETSQHPNHQQMLLDAFQDLCETGSAQVILTTHTPTLARKVNCESLRFIECINRVPNIRSGRQGDDQLMKDIAKTLGILPDHDVKAFVGVEGKWDIEFLKNTSKILNKKDSKFLNLEKEEKEGRLVFVPLGGSNLYLWVNRLAGLQRHEIYITDRDTNPPNKPKYQKQIDEWNKRDNCKAFVTGKMEIENYLHPKAIQKVLPEFPETCDSFDDVPEIYARISYNQNPENGTWEELTYEKKKLKIKNAKRRLNTEVLTYMTFDLFSESDPDGELKGWILEISKRLES